MIDQAKLINGWRTQLENVIEWECELENLGMKKKDIDKAIAHARAEVEKWDKQELK